MSDTTVQECKCCATDGDCIEGLCLSCREYGNKSITEHPDVQRLIGQVVELEAKLKAIKEQYAKDLVAEDTHFFPNPICQNQPPEITNGYNACLSCPMRKTCLLIFKTKP